MNELFTYGVETIERETKLYGVKKSSHNQVANYLQLDFLSHVVWLPFQVC